MEIVEHFSLWQVVEKWLGQFGYRVQWTKGEKKNSGITIVQYASNHSLESDMCKRWHRVPSLYECQTLIKKNILLDPVHLINGFHVQKWLAQQTFRRIWSFVLSKAQPIQTQLFFQLMYKWAQPSGISGKWPNPIPAKPKPPYILPKQFQKYIKETQYIILLFMNHRN